MPQVMEGPGWVLVSAIPDIIALSEEASHNAVDDTLLAIETACKTRSRVDTGQMRDGWESEMIGPHEGEVRNNVEHVIYNEYGTAFMAAQPMLTPSVEEEWPKFQDRMRHAYGAEGGVEE